MITIGIERLSDCLPEAMSLLPVHYDMLSLHKARDIPLQPQYSKYLADEASGICVTHVMREAGKIIGYWVHYVAPGRHYETCLTSIMDIFFISPEYRSGSAALRLMHAVEAENRRRGVQLWFAGEKLHSPVGRLFAACGFEPVERIWAKWIS